MPVKDESVRGGEIVKEVKLGEELTASFREITLGVTVKIKIWGSLHAIKQGG